MKRGQVAEYSIMQYVGIAIRVLAVVLLLVILGKYLLGPLISPSKSAAELNFERFLNDVDLFITERYVGQDVFLRFPVTEESVRLFAYGADSIVKPKSCGAACICLYESDKETCRSYPKLGSVCGNNCGEVRCIRSGEGLVVNKVISLRRGCDGISFS